MKDALLKLGNFRSDVGIDWIRTRTRSNPIESHVGTEISQTRVQYSLTRTWIRLEPCRTLTRLGLAKMRIRCISASLGPCIYRPIIVSCTLNASISIAI